MKKITAFLVILFILSTYVFAVNSPALTVGTVTADNGDTVTIPVTVKDNPGFAGFSFDVTYNKTYLTPVDASRGPIWSSSITHNIQEGVAPSGVLTVVGAKIDDTTDDGILCYIKFKISDSASGEYPLTLVNKGITNSNYEIIDFNTTNGKIDVAGTETITPPPISPTPVQPQEPEQPKEISVFIDGKAVNFDVAPVIIDDRTLVPMRAIFEQLGAYVWWEDKIKTAIGVKDSIMVAIAIDNPTMRKNDKEIALDVPAKLIDARTMVPLRAISEAYGCKVEWIDAKKQINIYTKGE
ncbi:MAG: hypothetical protein IKJ06_06540 [Clostridia bacterium]|nr:hypothetical protein [Clostridia bacterium]